MARILDKILPVSSERASKLYHKRDWLVIENKSLEEMYEDKKNGVVSDKKSLMQEVLEFFGSTNE